MQLDSLQIKNLTTYPNLVLAPMSGVTNTSFRKLMRELNPHSLGLVVTEFISIEGLTRGNKKTYEMLKFIEAERPISIQIFGYDVDRMVDSAKMVEEVGADVVDINCGCPVPKVVRRGGGCELMRQPEHLKKILGRVVSSVSIPVTLKIRSGWDENSINAVEISKMAEGEGVSAVTIHGRTRQQLYRGKADWSVVSKAAQAVSIPVIGSGDVENVETARECFTSGAKALMIGRASMENPFVFNQIYNSLTQNQETLYRVSDYLKVLMRYYQILIEDVGERPTVGKMKQLIGQITRKLPRGAEKRRLLCMMSCHKSMIEGIQIWLDEVVSLGQDHYVSNCSNDATQSVGTYSSSSMQENSPQEIILGL